MQRDAKRASIYNYIYIYIYENIKIYIYIYIATRDAAAEVTNPQVGSQLEKDPIDQAIVVKCVFRDAPSAVTRLACFSYFAWRAIASFQSGRFLVGSIESMLESILTSYLTDIMCCIKWYDFIWFGLSKWSTDFSLRVPRPRPWFRRCLAWHFRDGLPLREWFGGGQPLDAGQAQKVTLDF